VTLAPDEEPQRFFFVHLQKTAGTALFMRIRDHFGARAVYPMPEYRVPETSLDVDQLVERFARHRDEVRVVTGHFPLCVTELLGVPFTTFTVLREPVERALSFLRHQRKLIPEFQGASLEEVYGDGLRRELLLTNHMVRMLSLVPDEMTDGAMTQVVYDDARLERAKRNLAERIDVMGLQEHFEEFCGELADRFGWDLGEPRYANRTQPLDVSESLLEQIVHDNRLDVELYRFAVDLRLQRLAAASA
jgi:hypothetical protein